MQRISDIPLLKFTRKGYNTPFNALLGITKLAMTILGDNSSLPRIVWESETFDELIIDGKTVSFAWVASTCSILFGAMREKFDYSTLWYANT
ncbi:unnamed protein product [Umbelopsis vinacea]